MRRAARILVVDDQPANLALVRRILDPVGFEVSEARSGAETLAAAQEKSPDLILLDMHLPDMHGLDVLRRLRESARGGGVRVVAMSALTTPEDRTAWLKAGCVGVIEKPIDVRGFPDEVAQWLPGGRPPVQEERFDGDRREGGAEGEHKPDRLGELLVANLLISPEQLSLAVAAQPRSGKRLGQILVEQGALSEDDIAWALSHQLGYPYVFLTPEIVDAEAVRLLPEDFMREHRALPILTFGQEMTLAMVDPTDQRTVEEVVERTGLHVKRALALSSNIEEMQNRFFPGRPTPHDVATPPASAAEAQYFQFHLVQALQQGGSEIHFDPSGDGQARVRYRLQGVLVDRPGQPADLHTAILRYLRSLTGAGETAGMATTALTVGEREIVLAVTFLPTTSGEAATAALYPVQVDAPDLSPLGVSDEAVLPLREALHGASGVVLVGCGDRWVRTTVLHGLVPTGLRGKIWALETMPTYRRSTMNQTLTRGAEVEVNVAGAVEAGADLIVVDDAARADVLKAVLEAGRTRTLLAGHPESDIVGILSQAMDAAGAALVASALRAVAAARPIRLLCPACKQPANDSDGAFRGQRTFSSSGCEACGFTGFKGRRLLIDVWMVDTDSRQMLRAGHAGVVFERIQRAGSPMRETGRALVLDGLTSTGELTRVVG
jgi:type IV pilus assembly protein PilB